jgi:hypothetical protein
VQDRGHETSVAAADIHDRADSRTIVGGDDRGVGGHGDARQGLVEDLHAFLVPGEVGEDFLAEDVIESRLAGPYAVEHLAPGAVVPIFAEHDRGRPQRTGHARPQVFGERGQFESAQLALGENAQAGERPQHPIEGVGMNAGGRGQLSAAQRPVAQQVGDPELGGDVDDLRNPAAGDHLQ